MGSANISKYWVSPVQTSVGLLSAKLSDQDFPPHVHNALVIAVTESGGAKVKGRGESFMAKPQASLVFNPDESHSATKGGHQHWAFRSFYLGEGALEQLHESFQSSGCLYFMKNDFSDKELSALLLELHLLLESNSDRFAVEEKFAQSMGLLYARYGEAKPQAPPDCRNRSVVTRITRLLEDRFSEKLYLSELANEAGLTQFQLIGLFKNALGMTPYSMLTQIRLNKACSFLVKGMDICDVAVATGFYDQSALTRHFRRRYAVTPAQFAQAHLS